MKIEFHHDQKIIVEELIRFLQLFPMKAEVPIKAIELLWPDQAGGFGKVVFHPKPL